MGPGGAGRANGEKTGDERDVEECEECEGGASFEGRTMRFWPCCSIRNLCLGCLYRDSEYWDKSLE